MDWQAVRIFLHVAREGSISRGAARAGVSQPTASRQIARLEEEVGGVLLLRHSRGVEVTPLGEDILDASQDVEGAMWSLERRVLGSRDAPRGVVRVAASEIIGVEVLTPEIAAFQMKWPEISLELVLDNASSNLVTGEATLAVRLYPPSEPDLLTRKLGEIATGLFASRDYLSRRGSPVDLAQLLATHHLIGFDPRGPMARAFTLFEPRLEQASYALRTDSLTAHMRAARSGVGIAALQTPLARRHEELCQVLPGVELPALSVWLTTHQEMRRSEPVRLVREWLERVLMDYI